MRIVYDTNILIDYLNGVEIAKDEITKTKQAHRLISAISYLEVMAGTPPPQHEAVKRFLNKFQVLNLTPALFDVIIDVRQEHNIKLPDAIILGSALAKGAILITRDKQLSKLSHFVRIPYEL